MRSVVVVLPASICAVIPILRILPRSVSAIVASTGGKMSNGYGATSGEVARMRAAFASGRGVWQPSKMLTLSRASCALQHAGGTSRDISEHEQGHGNRGDPLWFRSWAPG